MLAYVDTDALARSVRTDTLLHVHVFFSSCRVHAHNILSHAVLIRIRMHIYIRTQMVAIALYKNITNFNKSKMDLKTKLLNFKGQEIVVPCSTWPCGEALFKEKVGEDWSNKHTPGIIQKVKLRASRNGFSVRKVQFDVNFPVAGQLVVVDIDYILEYFEDMPLGDRMLIKQELQKEADRAVARKKSKLPNSNSSINRPEISHSPEPKEGDDISTLEKDAKETVQFGNNPPTLPAEVVQKERPQTARAPPTKSAAQIIAELRATSANIVVSDADRDAARRTCDIVPEIIVASKTASSISSPTINTFPTALDDCTSVSISEKSPAKLLFSRYLDPLYALILSPPSQLLQASQILELKGLTPRLLLKKMQTQLFTIF